MAALEEGDGLCGKKTGIFLVSGADINVKVPYASLPEDARYSHVDKNSALSTTRQTINLIAVSIANDNMLPVANCPGLKWEGHSPALLVSAVYKIGRRS